MHHVRWLPLALLAVLVLVGCRGDEGSRVLGTFPLDDLDGLLTTRNVDIDTVQTTDGHGSLHFFAPSQRLVNLYNVPTPGLRGPCDLVWSLDVRTIMLLRPLDVEVWLFPEKGDPRMVRQHLERIQQTVEWTRRTARIPVEAGERIDRVRLAVYVDGMGHVWLDDMELRREPPAGS